VISRGDEILVLAEDDDTYDLASRAPLTPPAPAVDVRRSFEWALGGR
jgi:hypothetical protein